MLRLYAATNTTLALSGSYHDPTDRPIASGGSFQPGAGLEALTLPLQDASFAFWNYDSPAQTWQIHSPPMPELAAEFPDMVAPGGAIFVNSASSATLAVPDVSMRIRYYHQDHLGSSSVITDSTGCLEKDTFGQLPYFQRYDKLVNCTV